MTRQYFAENCFIQSGASFAFAREKPYKFLAFTRPTKRGSYYLDPCVQDFTRDLRCIALKTLQLSRRRYSVK